MRQFLKINVFIYLYLCLFMSTHPHTPCWFYFSGEPWRICSPALPFINKVLLAHSHTIHFCMIFPGLLAPLVAQTVKNPPVMQETQVRSLHWEYSLKGMATHSSIFPGKSHRPRSLGGYSPWGCKVRHEWATNTFTIHFHFQAYYLYVQPNKIHFQGHTDVKKIHIDT